MYHCTEALVPVPLHGGSSTCVIARRLQYMYHCMEALVHVSLHGGSSTYHGSITRPDVSLHGVFRMFGFDPSCHNS